MKITFTSSRIGNYFGFWTIWKVNFALTVPETYHISIKLRNVTGCAEEPMPFHCGSFATGRCLVNDHLPTISKFPFPCLVSQNTVIYQPLQVMLFSSTILDAFGVQRRQFSMCWVFRDTVCTRHLHGKFARHQFRVCFCLFVFLFLVLKNQF